ncbi:uncharacterized protein LOC115886313 [Sitophilus oryzae]|uniref:Uncharacterized protein LOC115886313 n=1 Tax=Sitophilus oryzae TaxID=7048 RepID=A0A6J2YBL9_SITOR|nr:uncharacterized protein LOC115886313 [Sitophilus oryzae]
MRFAIILVVLFSLGYATKAASSSNGVIEALIKIAIIYVETLLKNKGSIEVLGNSSISLDFGMKSFIDGTFNFQTLEVYGLQGLEAKQENLNVTIDDNKLSLCININAPTELGVNISNYAADIALVNAIPVYGNGDIKLAVRRVKVNICTNISLSSPIQLQSLYVRPEFRSCQVNITGFWNNDELSNILTDAFSLLEGIILTFWNSEIDCISCLLSSTLQSIVNGVLNQQVTIRSVSDYISVMENSCQDACGTSENDVIKKISKGEMSQSLQALTDEDLKIYITTFAKFAEEYLNQVYTEYSN